MCKYIYAYMYIYIYVYININTSLYIYITTCVYIYIYIHRMYRRLKRTCESEQTTFSHSIYPLNFVSTRHLPSVSTERLNEDEPARESGNIKDAMQSLGFIPCLRLNNT